MFDEYIKTLEELHSMFQSKKGLEIGLAWGHSARVYLESHPGATLTSIDPENEWNVCLDNLIWIKGKSPEDVPKEKYDFIYIDGNHDYGAVVEDIKVCRPMLNGVLAFDDYNRPNFGVTKAVDEMGLKPFFNKNHIIAFYV